MMRKNIYLSGAAVAVLMLATAPASAQLLNLGGGGDAGGGGGGGLSVDLGGNGGGGLLGGDGNGLLNLGGSGDADSTATVDADLGNGTILDLDGDGIGDGTLIDIDGDGIGDLIDLDGDGIGDQAVDVDLFGVGENGETQLRVGADGSNDELIVNLFGASGQGQTATANILPGGTGDLLSDEQDEATVNLGGDTDAVVDLFGNGSSEDTASIDIGGGGAGGGDADVTLDLFGPGAGDGTGGGGTGGAPGVDPTETGSTGGGGDGTGTDGETIFDPGTTGTGAGAATRVASTSNVRLNRACFAPDEGQIAHLLSRNSYDAGDAASWQSATSVSLVPIDLCPDARARLEAALAADGNIDFMQEAVAMNVEITTTIAPEYSADDVLAVDQSGEQLTVYVY